MPRTSRSSGGQLFDASEAEPVAEKETAIAATEEPAAPAPDEAEAAPAAVVEPEPEPAPAPVSRDIGNWRYTPWKGKPMWTNAGNSAWTSFNEAYVRRHRHMTAEPAPRGK